MGMTPEQRDERIEAQKLEAANKAAQIKLDADKLALKREMAEERARAMRDGIQKLSDDDIELGYSYVARDKWSSPMERIAALDSLRDMRGLKTKASEPSGAGDEMVEKLEATLRRFSGGSKVGDDGETPP